MSVQDRTRQIGEFEEGEWVRVYYKTSMGSPAKTMEVQVEMHYNEEKALVTDDEGRELILNLRERHSDNFREFRRDGDQVIGRAMFVEPASNPEMETGVEN